MSAALILLMGLAAPAVGQERFTLQGEADKTLATGGATTTGRGADVGDVKMDMPAAGMGEVTGSSWGLIRQASNSGTSASGHWERCRH